MYKNTAGQYIFASVVDSSDGSAKTTGVNFYITQDNGSQAAADFATHVGNGQWRIDLTQAETNADVIGICWAGTDVVPGGITVYPVEAKTQDYQTELGRLDAAITSRLAAADVPDHFSSLAITETTGKVTVNNVDECKADVSNVTVGTNLDKDGYGLSTSERSSIATAVWSATTRTLSSFGQLALDIITGVWSASTRKLTVGTRDTEIDTIVGKLPAGGIAGQTTLDAVNLSLTQHRGVYTTERAAKLDNLDATVTSRLAAASYTPPPTTADIANAIKSSTGWTAGNTMTLEQIVKILAAWSAGQWRDKEGVPGTYQILDPDDGTTVICEVTPSETTPQKTVSIV